MDIEGDEVLYLVLNKLRPLVRRFFFYRGILRKMRRKEL